MSRKYFKYYEFKNVKNCEDLKNYLNDRVMNHTEYFHYTKIDTINRILENNEFWLSNVSKFNDKIDSEQFEKDKRYYFSLCFSTGKNENLPLWYLYSGTSGKGARISISKKIFKKLIKNAYFTLYNEKTGEEVLIKDNEFVLLCGDMLYYKLDNYNIRYCDLKYNNFRINDFDSGELEKFKKSNKGFTKGIIWYYEKETRILVEIKNKQLINEKDSYIVKLKFDSNIKKYFKICLAPEIEDETFFGIVNSFSYIKKQMIESSKVKLSEYSGTIKMGLSKYRRRICPIKLNKILKERLKHNEE